MVGDKRRSKTHHNRITALQQNPDFFRTVSNLLCVLRTNHKAMAAQDALVADDMGLVSGKTNGLHRTVADAFIAILAVGLLER